MIFRNDFLITNRFAPLMGLTLAYVLGDNLLHKMAVKVGESISKRPDSRIMTSLRSNIAMIKGVDQDHPGVKKLSRQAIINAAIGNADLFSAIVKGKNRILDLCEMDPELIYRINLAKRNQKGKILIGHHTLGFEMFMLWFGLKQSPVFALTYSNPSGSYITHNILRSRFGLNLSPISTNSLKAAYKKLKKGKTILTAVDRTNGKGIDLNFFKKTVRIPSGPFTIAYKTQTKILLGFSKKTSQNKYRAQYGGCFEPDYTGNASEDIKNLAQKVITEIESFIRKYPEQWMMFHKVSENISQKQEKIS